MALLELKIDKAGRGTRVTIVGVVDETADLKELLTLTGSVDIYLSGLRRINSAGVRVWIDTFREVAQKANLTFHECSTTAIDQLNMMNGFLGHGRVESFYAALVCPICSAETSELFQTRDVEANDLHIPEARCPKCGGLTELDELEDQYLLFLREPTVIR